jgi:hypothetical protein
MLKFIFILLIIIISIKRIFLESYTNYESIKVFIKNPIFQMILNKNINQNLDQDKCLNEIKLKKTLSDTINSLPINQLMKTKLSNNINQDKNMYQELLNIKRKHNNLFPNKICKNDIDTIMSLFIKKYLNIN